MAERQPMGSAPLRFLGRFLELEPTMIATEIVDYILGFLRSDRTTLKTCSTVFPQLVDRHLYSHLTLRTPTFSSDDTEEAHNDIYYVIQFSELIPLLNERMEIAFCVQGLRIIITILPAPFVSLELLPMISCILPIFRKIKSIELRVEGTLSWTALGSDFCTPFQNLLRYPSINQVKIFNVDGFPLDSFDDCKNLRKLFLCGQFTDGEGVSASPYPRLSSLYIESEAASDSTKIVSWMKSNTLHTLWLRVHQSTDFAKFHPLIEACAATLVNLELDSVQASFAHTGDAEAVFGNTQFPALKSLVLRSGAACLGPGNHSSSLACFAPFLNALRSRSDSTPHSVHLSVHLQFRVLGIFMEDELGANIEWPEITFFDGLAVFRWPIELHILPRFSLPIRRYFEASSGIRKMVTDGKLTMIDGWEDYNIPLSFEEWKRERFGEQ